MLSKAQGDVESSNDQALVVDQAASTFFKQVHGFAEVFRRQGRRLPLPQKPVRPFEPVGPMQRLVGSLFRSFDTTSTAASHGVR